MSYNVLRYCFYLWKANFTLKMIRRFVHLVTNQNYYILESYTPQEQGLLHDVLVAIERCF